MSDRGASPTVEPGALLLPTHASLRARVLASPGGCIGVAVTATIALAALLAPVIAPADPFAQSLTRSDILQPPSLEHWLGTDALGRDMLSRILYGARVSLAIAGAALGIAVVLGVALGSTAGTLGGFRDRVVMRLMDSLLAFPLLVLAITISVALGRGAIGSVIAIAIVNLPIFTRLARGQALRINQQQYVTAAIVMGAGIAWRIWRHVIPNMLNPIVVQATVALSFAVLIESGLSFLGLGVQPPEPSWGLMVAEARNFMVLAPHLVFVPSAAIFATVLGLNLLGDALSDALDPRSDDRD
jgi:peptide/nickel transport system permease protein